MIPGRGRSAISPDSVPVNRQSRSRRGEGLVGTGARALRTAGLGSMGMGGGDSLGTFDSRSIR
jgi:hypothetical protein